MYQEHFGLSALPFENVPDPAFFYDAGEYHRVLARLEDAVAAGRGLMVVAGPVGSGKTTLSQKLMADLPPGTVHLWLAEPAANDRELFEMILERLGATHAWSSRVLALNALRERLLALRAQGGRFLLVVDESHKFTDEGLESVRLLNNLEQGAAKLIQVLMLGQDELAALLTSPGRENFRQRIANLETLARMPATQVPEYVRHRLRVAGGDPRIFPDLVLEAVAEAAAGVPRLTNSLCDRALLRAWEAGKGAVDTKDLLKAAEEVGVYRKAFHFLVAREQQARPPAEATAAAAPTPPVTPAALAQPAAPPAPAPSTRAPEAPPPPPPAPAQVPAQVPATAVPAPGATASASLLLPLALLAGGVAALAASLSFYCTRAAAVYGDGCLRHLLEDLFRR